MFEVPLTNIVKHIRSHTQASDVNYFKVFNNEQVVTDQWLLHYIDTLNNVCKVTTHVTFSYAKYLYKLQNRTDPEKGPVWN